MSQYPKAKAFKGILRNSDRNVYQPPHRRNPTYEHQQINSHDREIGYSSANKAKIPNSHDREIGYSSANKAKIPNSHDREIGYSSANKAKIPIFPDDESSVPSSSFKSGAKSSSKNDDLYAQAMAAKSNLGLLDTSQFSSALASLQDYGNHPELSNSAISQNKLLTSPPQSVTVRANLPYSLVSHSQDFQKETPSSYKYSNILSNSGSNAQEFTPFKSLIDLNLNSVEDEEEFLYGDTNPLPDIPPFNQTVHFNAGTKSVDAYMSDEELQSIETPTFGDSFSSVGEKLNISAWKKASGWNIGDDTVNSAVNINIKKPCEKELSPFSKQNRVISETHYHGPLRQSKEDYNTLPMSSYKSREQMRQSQNFLTSSKLASYTVNDCLSPNQFFSFPTENKSVLMASSNLLRKQSNHDRAVKNESIYQEVMHYDYNVPVGDETKRSRENEKTGIETIDKSVSDASVKFPKLLVNVEQDRISTKRIVHLKESYNKVTSPSKSKNPPSLSSSDKMENFELVDEVLQSKTIETHRVVCNESRTNLIKVDNIDHEGETGSVQSEDSRNSAQSVNVILNDGTSLLSKHSMEANLKEQTPKVIPYKYSSIKQGDKSYKQKTPERNMSPNYGLRSRSPDNSRRRSPNRRYRSRDHSPRYREYSPEYSNHWSRDHSPRYRSRERSGRRSPRHSSRPRDKSPRRRIRYRSRGRHSSRERRSYSPKDQSPHYPSSEKHSRYNRNLSPETMTKTVHKRPLAYSSDEEYVSSTACKISTSLNEKFGESSESFSETYTRNSDEIASKRGKMSTKINDMEGKPQNSLHSNEINMKTTETISKSSITVQNPKFFEASQDPPETDAKNSEILNSVLTKFKHCSEEAGPSTAELDLDVATTTSWTAAASLPATVSTSLQLNMPNIPQYGTSYPHQSTLVVPHMYPQYMYETPSVPQLSPNVHYNPLLPTSMSAAASFTYPSPPTSIFSISNNSKFIPSKARISCLKTVPVIKNVNLPKSKTPSFVPLPKDSSGLLSKNRSPELFNRSVVLKNTTPQTQKDDLKEEDLLMKVERYKKLLEERDIMGKKLRNTSDHSLEISKLREELENKAKTSRSAVDKMLILTCVNAFEKANTELNRYIKEARRLNVTVMQLQSKIKPEVLQKITANPEKTEKQLEHPLVSYTGIDDGGHWCEECKERFPTISKVIEHLHQKMHLQHVDPYQVVTTQPVRKIADKNAKIVPARGIEFIKPVCCFYCSLCKESLLNQSFAEQHVKENAHITNYKNFLKENPIYEDKRDLFKKIGVIMLAKEKRQTEVLKKVQDKLQDQKNAEKLVEELDESNMNVQNSPKNQKGVEIKLKLINEKNKLLETKTVKESDVKPKQKVVYIGRAPNFKPRNKNSGKTTILEKQNAEKDTVGKTEEVYDYDSLYAVSTDKSEKQSSSVLPSVDTISVGSKNLDSTAISKISVNPNDISENQTKDNLFDNESSKTKLNESNAKHKTKQAIDLKKNKTYVSGCPNESEAKKSDSKRSDDPTETHINKHQMNDALKNPKNQRTNAFESKVNLSETELQLETSFLDKSMEVPKPPPEPKRRCSLTEEEKDFLLLGINKSDMEPIAVPIPPPPALIHNHSDVAKFSINKSDMEPIDISKPPPPVLMNNHSDVAKLPPFPPPLQVPPPNIVSHVPPPTIASLVPPSNVISQVPPPNIISKVPPPNIISQIPPPNIASNLPNIILSTCVSVSSEQKQHISPASSSGTKTLPLKFDPFTSEQLQDNIQPANENIDVIDMEIDNDIVNSEIKFGLDCLIDMKGIPCSVKLSDNVSTSSLSPISLITTELRTSSISTIAPIVSEGNETVKQHPESATSKENGDGSSTVVVTNVDDDREMLRELLNLIMDDVTNELEESSEVDKCVSEKKVEDSLLSPNKISETPDSRDDHSGSICVEPERQDFKTTGCTKNFQTAQKTLIDDKYSEVSTGNAIEKCYNINKILLNNSSNDQNNMRDMLIEENTEENLRDASSQMVSSEEVETYTLPLNTNKEILELTDEILNTVVSLTSDELNRPFACTTDFQNSNSETTEKLENVENSLERHPDYLSSLSNCKDYLKNEKSNNEENSKKFNDCSSSFLNNVSSSLASEDSENAGNSKDIFSKTVSIKGGNISANIILPQSINENLMKITDKIQNNSTRINLSQKRPASFKNENELVENKVDDDLQIIGEYPICHKNHIKGKRKHQKPIPEVIELDSESDEMEITEIKEVKENTGEIPYVYNQKPVIKEEHSFAFKRMKIHSSTLTINKEKEMHVNKKALITSLKIENFDEKNQKSFVTAHSNSRNSETKLTVETESHLCKFIGKEMSSLTPNIRIDSGMSSGNSQDISNCISNRTDENMDCDDILSSKVGCTTDSNSDNFISIAANSKDSIDSNFSEKHPVLCDRSELSEISVDGSGLGSNECDLSRNTLSNTVSDNAIVMNVEIRNTVEMNDSVTPTSSSHDSLNAGKLSHLLHNNTSENFVSKATYQVLKDINLSDSESTSHNIEALFDEGNIGPTSPIDEISCGGEMIYSKGSVSPPKESSVNCLNTHEQNCSHNFNIKQENITFCPSPRSVGIMDINVTNSSEIRNDTPSSIPISSNMDKVQHLQNLEIFDKDNMYYCNEASLLESSGSESHENLKFVVKREENSEEETIRNEERRNLERTLSCKNVSSEPLQFIKIEKSEKDNEEETAEAQMIKTAETRQFTIMPNFPIKIEVKKEEDDNVKCSNTAKQQNPSHSHETGLTVADQKSFLGNLSYFDELNPSIALKQSTQDLKNEILSVPLLKKYDTDDILSDMSADGPPILNEHDESPSNSGEARDSGSITKADLPDVYKAEANGFLNNTATENI
ncbi:zinc finger protein 318 [Nephila pilipes]|uniref:Zinc finger protein 318 n=1 Tax=Nephila pilipes TaxID=299642 RepID=A0A8X6UKR1_NEPPI|nr:zinc finger protein 318 [Nephila pilipes]